MVLAMKSSKFAIFALFISLLALGGCGPSDLNASLQQIRDVPVDAHQSAREQEGVTADAKPLDRKDVAVMAAAAKALATEEGGVLRDAQGRPRMNIQVLPAAKIGRADDGRALLDVASTIDNVASIDRQAVAKELPDGARESPAAVAPVTGRYIQVGSFSNIDNAQAAWNALMQRGAVLGLRPQYQPVKSASGKMLVRLKVGPVADEAKARSLCNALNVTDTWCVRAS
jgi:cell division septation protein DedD